MFIDTSLRQPRQSFCTSSSTSGVTVTSLKLSPLCNTRDPH